MRHLRHAVVELDPAADDPLGADRKQARQIVAFDVEVDEGQGPGVVGAEHPVRPAPDARFVRLDPHLQGDDLVGFEVADRGRRTAVDDA